MVGIAIMAVGVIYWAAWRILPGYFGYELIPRKETLEDGTVVTLVCGLPICLIVPASRSDASLCFPSSRTKRSSEMYLGIMYYD